MAEQAGGEEGARSGLDVSQLVVTLGLRTATVNALAFASLLVLLSTWPTWIAILLAALALARIAVLQRLAIVTALETVRPLGTYQVARLLVATMAAAQIATANEDVPTRIAFAIVGMLVIGEPTVRTLAMMGAPYAARIPGVTTRDSAWFGAGIVWVVNTLGIAALVVVAFTSLPGWLVLAWAVVCLGVSLAACYDALDRIRSRRRFEARIRSIIARQIRPVFALHWEAPRGTAYQIAMWLPYLERLGVPFFILVRSETNFADVLDLDPSVTTAPVILRKALTDIDPIIVPSLKTFFYVNTATKNAHTIRYADLTHIQLNHGDSDKAPSYNPVFRMYDKDFVAGQAAIDRFADHGVDMPPGIFTVVGRPQVEGVHIAQRAIAEIADPTVLYAPTWAGFYADSNYSSLPVGYQVVESLVRRGCAVVFRPHPYARRSAQLHAECDRIIELLRKDAASSGRAHVVGAEAEREMTIFDCFNRSDAMVSDVSSVVGDYLYSEKPFAMVAMSEPADSFVAEFPVARAAYILEAHDGALRGLEPTLDAMLGPDPLAGERRALKTYYLGDIPAEHYAERFLDEARRFL